MARRRTMCPKFLGQLILDLFVTVRLHKVGVVQTASFVQASRKNGRKSATEGVHIAALRLRRLFCQRDLLDAIIIHICQIQIADVPHSYGPASSRFNNRSAFTPVTYHCASFKHSESISELERTRATSDQRHPLVYHVIGRIQIQSCATYRYSFVRPLYRV